MKLPYLFLIAFMSTIDITCSAAAPKLNCEYTISWETYPNKKNTLIEALDKKLKMCDGKNPCMQDESHRTTVNFQVQEMKNEAYKENSDECQKEARVNCVIMRKGIYKSKKVKIKFENQELDTIVCKENGEILTIPVVKIDAPKVVPLSDPSSASVISR